MLDFKDYLESIEPIPAEFERNFNLIRDLDSRTFTLIGTINDLMKKYKESRRRAERDSIKKEINGSMEKLLSYADDKIDVSEQSYQLIDRNIQQLIEVAKSGEPDGEEEKRPPGFNMPIDEHEPRYCLCGGVSFGNMIACDNPECRLEWFHYPCVRLITAPKGKWYCGECLVIMRNKKKPKKRASGRRKR